MAKIHEEIEISKEMEGRWVGIVRGVKSLGTEVNCVFLQVPDVWSFIISKVWSKEEATSR